MRFRSMTLGAGLAVALMIPVAPASATHQPSTASVDRREALAGTEEITFRFYVAHPGAGATESPPPINFVRVAAPEPLATPVSASAIGWNWIVQPGAVVFTGGQLNANQSAYFDVVASVARFGADVCGEWSVQVSSDAGETVQAANPTYGGALGTCVRVLQVQILSLVAPAGVADNTVTEGQSGVCGRMRIFNGGNAELPVLPAPEGARITVGAIRAAADPPCSGMALTDNRVAVSPGGTATVEFELSFGAAGNTYLYGRASAPGADAMQTSLYISIQPRPMFGVSKVEPKSVGPGASGVSFSVEVAKGPSNSPGVDLAGTTLEWTGCPPREIQPPTRFPDVFIPEQPPVKRFSFQPCNVAQIPDGRYDALIRLRTLDDNGMSSLTEVIAGKIRVDSVPPQLWGGLVPPPPDCCVPPERPAVRNADTLGIQIEVRDQDPDTGLWEPCPECQLELEARLLQFSDENGTMPGGPAIQLPPGSSSFNGTYGATTRSIRLEATAKDEAGLGTTAVSAPLDVDNIAPRISQALATTGPGPGERRRVMVSFNECVAGTSGTAAIFDWEVVDELGRNPVTEIRNQADCRTLELRVLRDFSSDPQGTLSYRPAAPIVSSRPYDRVGIVMPDQTGVPLSDGI